MREYVGIREDVAGSISNNGNGYYNLFSKFDVLQCPSFEDKYALTYVVNSMDFEKAAKGSISEMHHASTKGFDLITSPESSSETCLFTELNSKKLAIKNYGGFNIWKYSDLPYNEHGAPQYNGRMLNSASQEHYGKGVAVFFDGHATVYSTRIKGIFSNSFINGN
jgi:prepilin-type processing-associated H-X9-DG protein